jgi:hypothetical protein
MKVYAAGQGRQIEDANVETAMTWSEPSRDVRIAREQAEALLGSGKLFCVWTGRPLSVDLLDIDHCFPWSAWPCDDLWNLLPTHRGVNQRLKRDKLPGTELLLSAQDRIRDWWNRGYMNANNEALSQRFVTEARATLPIISYHDLELRDVFAALQLQQTRLERDQQVPVWEPTV